MASESLAGKYSMRSPAVKRLMREAQELHEPTEQYFAQPLEDNLFEWHFTVRGPVESEFDGGIYHGRICLPPDYPMKPPSIILLTPNGRFELHKKICLSISAHHPESWHPCWSIRTALLAIIGFMPTHGAGAIGSLDYTPDERKVLARKSQEWTCSECKKANKDILKPVTAASASIAQEAKEISSQMAFKSEEQQKAELDQSDGAQKPRVDEPATVGTAAIGEDTVDYAADEQPAVAITPESAAQCEVRQRNIASSSNQNASSPSTDSVAHQQHHGSVAAGGKGSLVVIMLLILAIALLVARRVYMSVSSSNLLHRGLPPH